MRCLRVGTGGLGRRHHHALTLRRLRCRDRRCVTAAIVTAVRRHRRRRRRSPVRLRRGRTGFTHYQQHTPYCESHFTQRCVSAPAVPVLSSRPIRPRSMPPRALRRGTAASRPSLIPSLEGALRWGVRIRRRAEDRAEETPVGYGILVEPPVCHQFREPRIVVSASLITLTVRSRSACSVISSSCQLTPCDAVPLGPSKV